METKEIVNLIEEAAKVKRTDLDLGNKELTSLPEAIGKLTKLKQLYLNYNQLTALPEAIGNLINLERLYLNSNQLTALPEAIGNLTNLEELTLDFNQLTALPDSFSNLKVLNLLFIDRNNFIKWPFQVDKLNNLESFSIDIKYFSDLVQKIDKFPNLVELYLDGQKLSELPEAIGKLTNLKQLYLNGNQLTALPEAIGKLTNLKQLNLNGNQFTALPEAIGNLANLEKLDLKNNQLTALPEALGKLTNLKVLGLGGNPLKTPPQELLEAGTKAVLKYLQELEKKSKKRYEAKLLMLGDGGEGKTCVSRALRKLKFKPQVTTRGVDVVPWTFSHPEDPKDKNKDITLNIWDFEGQEIHHQTHQFFLTEDALYVLVFKCREIFRMDRAEYWLDTIRARAPQSRVFLVITECEERTPYIPLDKLKNNYSDLLQGENWFFPVGCADDKGIPELRRHLQTAAAHQAMMGQNWPDSYSQVEKTLENIADEKSRNDPHITRKTLYSIFQDKGIEEAGFDNLAVFLSKLGIITHFPDCPDLYDFIVIKPQWLTKAVSLILEDNEVINSQGEVSHNRLRKLWGKKYPGMYSIFHNCMKEFELCYDLETRQSCLIPLRFAFSKPEIPWSITGNYKERRITYKLNIRPPMGIMSRFIVKTHHMIVKTATMEKGVYWHTGVFLESGQDAYKSEALCEFDNENKKLTITVRAAFPQSMIEQLHGIAKAVYSFFNGLEPERYYGCVKIEDEKESFCGGQYSEQRILYALSKEKSLDCEIGWHEVSPNVLLYGFTSFGQFITQRDLQKALRKELDKKPEWAEKDFLSMLEEIGALISQVNRLQEQGKEVGAELKQRIDLGFRNHLTLFNEILDNRDFNSAPAIVAIVPVNDKKWNPKTWFENKYELIPYCEFESEIHRMGRVCEPFIMPKPWWEKTAPKLAIAVKILSAGVKIACAGLPLGVDPELFKTMKNDVDFMKELASHLELKGGAFSDITSESAEYVESTRKNVADLRQKDKQDINRIARVQLAALFEEIAPDNYKSRQWGQLRRVPMNDNTYRWLCDTHAKKLGK